MPARDKAYIKACLEEAIRWIDENDNLPDEMIDLGTWFSDLGRSEILCFFEAPRYVDEHLDPNDVDPYQLIAIPLPREDFEELYSDEDH